MNSNNNNKNNQYSVRLVKDSGVATNMTVATVLSLLYSAYLNARRNKRNTKSQLRFEANLESNLIELAEEIVSGNYKPRPSICFINDLPVKREVIAADFRDRVVQHMLCSWLFPIFERQFIHDSYSCREGKGTLLGINRVRGFVRSESDDFRKDCWVLRLDIKGFFMSILKPKLYELVMDGLERGQYAGVPDRLLCDTLVRQIIFANPLDNAVFASPPEKWIGLPPDKSLLNTDGTRGLPIGNLTSQLFGNVYLNRLDQYIKRDLKIRGYGRYVDDMVLVHCDKSILLNCIPRIRSFLKNELSLVLHPKKIQLQPATHGFSFIGAYILPYRKYPTRRIWHNSIKAYNSVGYSSNREATIRSYRGMFSFLNGNTMLR